MADNVAVTAGTGTGIKTDQDSGDASHMQVMKLAISANGDSTLIPATAADGLSVKVTAVVGTVAVTDNAGTLTVDDGGLTLSVDDGAASLTVDAPVGTPAFVRLSDGTNPIATLPVSDAGGSLTVDGAVTVSGTVAATQSGTWNVATLTTITNVVHIDDNAGNISIDDGGNSITIDGTVTVTQGTAAAAAGAWPMKISDGTDTVGISTVSAAKALKVDIVQTVGFAGQVDGATFTDLTSKTGILGAIYNGFATDLTTAQGGALRCTSKRALHVVLQQDMVGGGLGQGALPMIVAPGGSAVFTVYDGGASLSVDDNAGSLTVDAPVGTPAFVRLSDGTNPITTLPISGAVTQSGAWTSDLIKINGTTAAVAAAGILKVGIVDGVGAVWSHTNPMPVANDNLGRTRVTNSNTLAAGETAVAIWTPTGSTKAVITSITITNTVGGLVTIYDGTNVAANWIFKGTLPVGLNRLDFSGHPFVSAAVNNVIRYTTSTGVVAELQMHGFESA